MGRIGFIQLLCIAMALFFSLAVEKLKAQLERQARRFLNHPRKGYVIDRDDNVLRVSKIFQFDKKSFSGGIDDIVPFISEFIDNNADAEFIKSKKYRLEFLDYDWDLNTLRK